MFTYSSWSVANLDDIFLRAHTTEEETVYYCHAATCLHVVRDLTKYKLSKCVVVFAIRLYNLLNKSDTFRQLLSIKKLIRKRK